MALLTNNQLAMLATKQDVVVKCKRQKNVNFSWGDAVVGE